MSRIKSNNKQDESEKIIVSTFGGLSIYFRNAPITIIWESQKARLLFCYLLVTYDQWIHRDKLIDLLWPGCNVGAGANNFKTTVSRLRKSFTGAQCVNPVITQGEGVRININAFSLDASQFRSKAITGIKLQARGELKSARQYLEAAQDLYMGDFLSEEPFNTFITATRNELAELNSAVIRSLEKIYQQEGNRDGLEAIFALKKSFVPELV